MKHQKIIRRLLGEAISKEIGGGERILKPFDATLFRDRMFDIVKQEEVIKCGYKAGELYCLMQDFYETQIEEILADDAGRKGQNDGEGDPQELPHP